MRIILYTGKGGVGKTSVAAATALRSAGLGYRTIVISTDAAHSLADSFDMTIGPDPTPLANNLWGQEIDIYHQIEEYYGIVQDFLTRVLAWRGLDDVVAADMTAFPGMEELASLLEIVAHQKSGKYDVIIIDAAPTGETLKFLSFPDVARWWLDRIFPISRQATRLLRPMAGVMLDNIPMPSDDVFDAVKDGVLRLEQMHDLLANPKISTIRLVVNAEKMVIKEAQRTYTYLNLYGYPTDLVVVNRLLPPEVSDTYFSSWREIQDKYYQVIEESFTPLPIRRVPLFGQEVVGIRMLEAMATAIFGDEDPTTIFHTGKRQTITHEDGRYVFCVPLPLVSKEALDLTRVGDELVVRIGNQRRNFILPRALVNLEISEARLENGELRMVFLEKTGGA